MKTAGVLIGAVAILGGCASAPMAPPPVQTGQIAPCQPHPSLDARDATQTFGTCLAMADGLAAARKPSAEVPDATHWKMPVMEGFIAGTTHGGSGG